MLLRNTVQIDAPLDVVWTAVLDVPAIVPCIPGAEVRQAAAEGEYAGTVRIKVGPLALSLDGELAITSVDPVARKISLRASGRDRHGLGHVDAAISLTAQPRDGATFLEIGSDVRLGGAVAQVGREAVVTKVATSMLERFAHCLSTRLQSVT
jgi:carbon monoxide dehydrogenase subunit G